MRRFMFWLFVIPALAVVAVFALNNRTPVVFDLWPFSLEMEMPVYLAFLAVLAAGVLIGGFVTWLGQGRMRASLREQTYQGEVARRELMAEREKTARLERDLDALKSKSTPPAVAAPGTGSETREPLPPPS